MGKFDGILLMSDLDGTLCSGDEVSRENCDAIRYFQSEGGLFSIGSGRHPDYLLHWKDYFVPNTWSAMLNGAVLCDAEGKNFIFDEPSGTDLVEVGLSVMRDFPEMRSVAFCACTDSAYRLKRGEEFDPSRLPSPVYKGLFSPPKEYSDEYTARLKELLAPDYLVMRSWFTGIEFQKAGTGKGDAVKRLKLILGDRARLAVAVGNYENDIDMIAAADVGYAVGDALPSVIQAADRVTVPFAEHAISQIIRDLEQR